MDTKLLSIYRNYKHYAPDWFVQGKLQKLQTERNELLEKYKLARERNDIEMMEEYGLEYSVEKSGRMYLTRTCTIGIKTFKGLCRY